MSQETALQLTQGITPARYVSLNSGRPVTIAGAVVEEIMACISLNGEELATFMCSPHELDQLALGFLFNEGLVGRREEIRSVHISHNNTCVDIWLYDTGIEIPKRAILTAGCGGGITFDDLSQKHEPVISEVSASPEQLSDLMRQMHLGAKLYQQARGVHSAALADLQGIVLLAEDVGRHNCLDRLQGMALLNGRETQDHILLSSGRISSEMINKARRMGVPIVCSRTSPTSLSVALADSWNMSIVAYLRQDRMRIYTHPERILGAGVSLTEIETYHERNDNFDD